ncbi:MAG: hypothetical protein HC828_20240 [Blastochloris sp.]|nr:hypothetical protein [Blastochloris sp.]
MSTFVSWPLPRQAELLPAPPPMILPLALAIAIALVFGTVPALVAVRRDLAASRLHLIESVHRISYLLRRIRRIGHDVIQVGEDAPAPLLARRR